MTLCCEVELTLFFGHPEATHQLLQRQRLVVADVTVLHKLLHTLLWLGFLAQEAFERLDLLLSNVPTGVFVQLTEIPVDHSLLQGVAGVRLGHPRQQISVHELRIPLLSLLFMRNLKISEFACECHTFRWMLDL